MTIIITYFVHGTTLDNEQGISTGQGQGKLSPLGIQQSKELHQFLQSKKRKYDLIFCSDLTRAIESARIMFPDQEIIQDKRLREGHYGKLNGAKEDKVVYEDHINKPFPMGESLVDVEKRIKSFLTFLKEKYNHKNIAIVAHKAPQLALDVLLKGKNWKEALHEDWRKTKGWMPGWEYVLE